MARSSLIFMLSFIFLAAWGFVPMPAFSSEDTVHLSFTKQVEKYTDVTDYEVQSGDWLMGIVRRQLKPPADEIPGIIEKIKEINPAIKNVNLIFPGQILHLPIKKNESDKNQKKGNASVSSEHTKKPGTQKADRFVHVVRKGESISKVLIQRFGVSPSEAVRYIGRIRSLNPHISDLNRIYPGQKIFLPVEKRGAAQEVAESALSLEIISGKKDHDFVLPRKERLPVLAAIFDFLQGEVITSGDYYVPLPPSSQMTIDCSNVPVAEMKNGNKFLIDLDGLLPLPVKKAIESRWKNHRIISGGSETSLSDILDKTIEALRSFIIQKNGTVMTIGEMPKVQVYCDWILSRRDPAAGSSSVIGIRLVKEKEQIIPPEVRQYAKVNGVNVIEIMNGRGIVAHEEPAWSLPVPCLGSGTPKNMTFNLISELGYVPVKDDVIPLFTMAKDGFDLAVTADISFEAEGKRILVNSGSISPEFCDLLRKKGTLVVDVNGKIQDTDVIKNLAAVLNLSCTEDEFSFSHTIAPPEKGWKIVFPGMRMRSQKGELYFVHNEFNGEIHHLINENWKVKVVSY
ncbi:MAG: LysM peptidoglycan-binding domain-containing protein [Syntrophales bacterium]|nr:LysM peptidoglycan-binding domain-containing protein [Syntrophales bacterium]